MTIDLTKRACSKKDDQGMKTEDVHKKYLLGTYNQEEAIQLVKKYDKSFPFLNLQNRKVL